MAKGTYLTDEVKQLIAKVYLEHPNWGNKEIQKEVVEISHRMDKYLEPDWPGYSVVQKELAKIRAKQKQIPPESLEIEKPWCTSSLVKYPIVPNALPSVLSIWLWMKEHENNWLTIREALWIARLYTITTDTRQLMSLAIRHSRQEKMSELLGKPWLNTPLVNIDIFEIMTGQKITQEREKKIMGTSEEIWCSLTRLERDRVDAILADSKTTAEARDNLKKAFKKGDVS